MGFIRVGLIFILTILMFLSFFGMLVFATLNSSLDYKNVKENSKNLIENLSGKEIFGLNITEEKNQIINKVEDFCQSNQSQNYALSYKNYTINVPCSTISYGKKAILDEAVESFIYSVYFKEYKCGFFNCFKTESPIFLISKTSQNYWKEKFYFILGLSLILISLDYFLVKHKTNWPIHLGFVLLASSFAFVAILNLFSSVIKLPYLLAIEILFNKAGSVFWTFFIISSLILLIGFVTKIILFRNSIKKFFFNFKKKIKEITEKKKEDIITFL